MKTVSTPNSTLLEELARVQLSDSDKQRLRDAFEAAADANPGVVDRKDVEENLNNGNIFKTAEQALSAGIELDALIDMIKGVRISQVPQP